MANPRPDDDPRPENSQEAEKNWRERFPGWETFDGRPNDPRYGSRIDPNQDIRFSTNLNPSSVVARRPGLVVYALGAFLGLLLLVLLGFLMYRHFQTPAPRSPQPQQTGQLLAPPTARMEDGVADAALPLRREHHVHQLPEGSPLPVSAQTQRPTQPKPHRASLEN
jgi:hypothetical protein